MMLGVKSLVNKAKLLKEANESSNIYLGYLGRKNYGDDLLFDIHSRINKNCYIPCLDISRFQKFNSNSNLVLGGGTIINGPIYLDAIQKIGRKPDYTFCSGVIDRPLGKGWDQILDECQVYTRSIESARRLRAFGIEAKEWVDPGIFTSILYPFQQMIGQPDNTRFLICPHGKHSNLQVFSQLIENCSLVKNSEITLFASSYEDLPLCLKLGKKHHCRTIKGWKNIEASNQIIAESDLVVSTRLHPAVVSSSYGVPFFMIAYEVKQYEFINSIGASGCIFKEDEILRTSIEPKGREASKLRGVLDWHKTFDKFTDVFGN